VQFTVGRFDTQLATLLNPKLLFHAAVAARP